MRYPVAATNKDSTCARPAVRSDPSCSLSTSMSSCCLPYLIGLFLKLGLITEQFAETLLCWRHSGFSVDYANWNRSAPRRTVEA